MKKKGNQNQEVQRLKKLIGANVSSLRKGKGLSLRKVGAEIGMSPAKIGKIERGEHVLRATDLFRLGKYYKVKVYDLFQEQ